VIVLDAFLGDLRLWRRLRGGVWLNVFHVPSAAGGWIRATREGVSPTLAISAFENYTLPRAKALP
jgi:hypothetical protein